MYTPVWRERLCARFGNPLKTGRRDQSCDLQRPERWKKSCPRFRWTKSASGRPLAIREGFQSGTGLWNGFAAISTGWAIRRAIRPRRNVETLWINQTLSLCVQDLARHDEGSWLLVHAHYAEILATQLATAGFQRLLDPRPLEPAAQTVRWIG